MFLSLIYLFSFLFLCSLGFSFEATFCELLANVEVCFADPSGSLLAVGFLFTGIYFLLAIPGLIAIYLRFIEKSIYGAKYYTISIFGSFLLLAILNSSIWPRHVEPVGIEEALAGIRFGIIIFSNLLSLFILSQLNTFRS